MRPCRVCGNETKGELNRHHLLPKYIREKGRYQITIKLCKDGNGCRVHLNFHNGDLEAARAIRDSLELWEVMWMVFNTSWDWVEETYPRETSQAMAESYSYPSLLAIS